MTRALLDKAEHNIPAIQVRTGKFREADLAGAVTPDAVLDRFADIRAWWQAQ